MGVKIPERGDIIVYDFSPTKGHEQSGNRPALVLSNYNYNSKMGGLILICPITNRERGYFFEVKLDIKKTKGVILSHQVTTIDYSARKIKIVDKVDVSVIKEVTDKIKVLIEG